MPTRPRSNTPTHSLFVIPPTLAKSLGEQLCVPAPRPASEVGLLLVHLQSEERLALGVSVSRVRDAQREAWSPVELAEEESGDGRRKMREWR
jgi:hypothetical protein